MPHEIELKFVCEARDLAKVAATAPIGEEQVRHLTSVYFDTPDGALRRKGASLRVRHSKGRRIQTLKRGEGLVREEHEGPIDTVRPDPSVGPLRHILKDRAAALEPVFEVEINRRQRLLNYGEAVIELALDEGEVRAGGQARAISEVELELKSGDPAALFDLARVLATAAPLYLSFTTKAAQGHALLASASAGRATPPDLPRAATAATAFQATAREALAQIAANAAALRDGGGPGAVHQLRVGARRLRSALITFRPLFGKGEAARLKVELKWLAKACDSARNLDVFAEESVVPARADQPQARGVAALAQAVEVARAEAQVRAAQAASSKRFRRLMIDALGWVETGDWLRSQAACRPAGRFAARRLDSRRRKLMKAGHDLPRLDDHGRHLARIEAKKLRYAAEAFAGLFPGRATRRFVARLKAVQDSLGKLNDLATAPPMIAELALGADAAFAAGELTGSRLADKPRLLARAAKALGRLEDTPPFWFA